MSLFLAYKSKTTAKGPLETAVPYSREKQLTKPRDSRTYVSAVTVQLNSDKNEESTLSSSTNHVQRDTSEATDYRRDGNGMFVGKSSLMSRQSSSISKRECTFVSRKETTLTSKTATNVMSMESTSVLQKGASLSSKRESNLMSKETSSLIQKKAASSSSSLMALETSSMSQKESRWMSRSREATLMSSRKTSIMSKEYSSESKMTNRMSLESSSTSEQRSRSTETSLKSRKESSFSSIMSDSRSNKSSFKSISSTSHNESSTTSQDVSAISVTKSQKADELGDKGWYYELLLRLENLRWNYQNLEAEYAFLEKLMAEQKQDLKKAQSWTKSMKKQIITADAPQVSLD